MTIRFYYARRNAIIRSDKNSLRNRTTIARSRSATTRRWTVTARKSLAVFKKILPHSLSKINARGSIVSGKMAALRANRDYISLINFVAIYTF